MRISEYKSLMRNRRQEMRQLWCREGGEGGYIDMQSPEPPGSSSSSQLSPSVRLASSNFDPSMMNVASSKGYYYPNDEAISPGGNSSTNYDSSHE